MFGKHFESMYEGSMYGAGINVFAVWGYVIAKTQKSRIEINPQRLADTLGGHIEDVIKALEFLMRPDPQSRHQSHGGRRLVKEGEFQYFVPSWEDYRRIRDEDQRREYNRVKQAEYRKKGKPLAGEISAVKAMARGDHKEAERIAATPARDL